MRLLVVLDLRFGDEDLIAPFVDVLRNVCDALYRIVDVIIVLEDQNDLRETFRTHGAVRGAPLASELALVEAFAMAVNHANGDDIVQFRFLCRIGNLGGYQPIHQLSFDTRLHPEQNVNMGQASFLSLDAVKVSLYLSEDVLRQVFHQSIHLSLEDHTDQIRPIVTRNRSRGTRLDSSFSQFFPFRVESEGYEEVRER
ncbi:hypothetical protein Pmani_031998 [Petrolisthes manimaculis]|uniref:Uncharacterized protein n=1 Tax=Petrolisthes manimaculis TaxID=1843537 RepID=A0AAE1TRF2_9EUCA|nr:hypothetical protein Pmani_031998 [Petrolisthes manimaculis]